MTEVVKLEERKGYLYWGSILYEASSNQIYPNSPRYIKYKGKWYLPSNRHIIEEIPPHAFRHFFLTEIYSAKIEGDFLKIKSEESEIQTNIKYGYGLDSLVERLVKDFLV